MPQDKDVIIQQLYDALRVISKDYASPAQLRRQTQKDYGENYREADFHDVLEMAYENIKETARQALVGVRRPKHATPQ